MGHNAVVSVFTFNDCELDEPQMTLRRGGEPQHVEPQVFELLRLLIKHRDRVVGKDELLDGVWGNRFISDAAISSRVKDARRAVGDDGRSQAVIRTVQRRGFQFVAEVTEHDTSPAYPMKPPAEGPSAETRAEAPPIHYTRTVDGLNIAYATAGTGPPIVRVLGWMTHLNLDWDWGVLPWAEIARNNQLVRYDSRGMGLSDRAATDFSLEHRLRDLDAVFEATGLERATLLGTSEGGSAAITYAISHPERVSRLILYGSGPYLVSESRARALYPLVLDGWGRGVEAFRQLFSSMFIPDGTRDDWHAFNELQRDAASPEAAANFILAVSKINVSELLPKITVPTLVLHRTGDQMVAFRRGQALAAGIPGAIMVPLEGNDHLIQAHDFVAPKLVKTIDDFVAEI